MQLARTLPFVALATSTFLACSSDSSTSPQTPQPPALEGTWRYPKSGGADAGLFRFTLEFRKDTVIFQGFLDGSRLDSVGGLWSTSGDTIVASFKDSVDFDPMPTSSDKGSTITTLGAAPKVKTLKWLRAGSELYDPIHQIEMGKP